VMLRPSVWLDGTILVADGVLRSASRGRRRTSETGAERAMPHGKVSAIIPASSSAVFDLLHDYTRRLRTRCYGPPIWLTGRRSRGKASRRCGSTVAGRHCP
jgi:hypothetical protein